MSATHAINEPEKTDRAINPDALKANSPADLKRAERKAISDSIAFAFAAISNAIRISDASSDLSDFMAFGGAMAALPDRRFITEFLTMVNENQEREALFSRPNLRASGLVVDDKTLRYWVDTLSHIQRDPVAVARANADAWRRVTQSRVVSVPDMTTHDGRADMVTRTVILGVEAAHAHCLRLLTSNPYCDELRRCELKDCGNFFLPDIDRLGPPPKYCCDEHRQMGYSMKSKERVKKSRAKVATKQVRGSK